VDVFPGSKNPLRISRKYSTVFVCDFKLVLYPFDEQYCDLHFRVLSASQNYLYFDIETALAEYEGGTVLIEYEVRVILSLSHFTDKDSLLKSIAWNRFVISDFR